MHQYAEVFVEFLPTSDGGRRTPVSLAEVAAAPYRPHFRVRSGDDEYLAVEFVDGPDEPVPPGGSAYATVRFTADPNVSYDSLSVNAVFDICEGGGVVGSGRVVRR